MEGKNIIFNFDNVPEEDILKLSKELQSNIAYITSGARDRYLVRKALEYRYKEMVTNYYRRLRNWGVDFDHTNYTSHELSYYTPITNHRYHIDLPYSFERFPQLTDLKDYEIKIHIDKNMTTYEQWVFHNPDEVIKFFTDMGNTFEDNMERRRIWEFRVWLQGGRFTQKLNDTSTYWSESKDPEAIYYDHKDNETPVKMPQIRKIYDELYTNKNVWYLEKQHKPQEVKEFTI